MGSFDPNAPGIEATDDPAVAEAHGLTVFDESRGQYVQGAEGDDDVEDEEETSAQVSSTDLFA